MLLDCEKKEINKKSPGLAHIKNCLCRYVLVAECPSCLRLVFKAFSSELPRV